MSLNGNGHAPESPAVEVEGLTKVYQKTEAVRGISFSIPRRSIFTLVGPNGAGKTSTIEILEAIRKPTGGSVRVLGHEVVRDADKVRHRIGVLPQDFRSFGSLTARETLEYFAGLYPNPLDVDKLLNQFGLVEHANQRFERLSGGLQRRVGIAAALVNDPELVFLDEPTAGVDPLARRALWDTLRSLRASGKTIFLTTHYMDEAEALSDTVAIIADGRIVAHGNPQELVRRHGGPRRMVLPKLSAEAVAGVQAQGRPLRLSDDGAAVLELEPQDNAWGIASAFEANGVPLREVVLKEPSLDDVFVAVTANGHKRREGP